MSLLSLFRKNKQALTPGEAGVYSRVEAEPKAARSRGKRSDPAVDPVLPEKKRARRRLVGALALVLAAVIGLPMILDSEPKPLAENIAIDIPARDKPIASATHPSASVLASVPVVVPVPKEEKLPVLAPPAPPIIAPVPLSKIDHAPALVESSSEAAPAKPDTKPVASTTKKSGKFAVQVAALSSKDKIGQLQARLKSAGIASYTQKIATESGDYVRIRVGPFASKAEAEKMRARLNKLGLSGTLIPPPEPHH